MIRLLPRANDRLGEGLAGTSVACSLSLHCTQPENNGEMQVEVSYEGDLLLLSYLLETLQERLESDINSSH